MNKYCAQNHLFSAHFLWSCDISDLMSDMTRPTEKTQTWFFKVFFCFVIKDLPMKFESEQRARTTRSPQWCWNRAPQYLAYHLTLLQPGRADYPHHWHPQGFSPSGITALIPDKNICKRQNAWYFFPPSSSVMKKSPFTPWNFLLTFLESP